MNLSFGILKEVYWYALFSMLQGGNPTTLHVWKNSPSLAGLIHFDLKFFSKFFREISLWWIFWKYIKMRFSWKKWPYCPRQNEKQHQFELKPMSSNFHFSITSQQGVEISTKYTIIPRTNTDKMTAPSTEIQLIQLLLLKFLGECSLLDFPSQRAVFRVLNFRKVKCW